MPKENSAKVTSRRLFLIGGACVNPSNHFTLSTTFFISLDNHRTIFKLPQSITLQSSTDSTLLKTRPIVR